MQPCGDGQLQLDIRRIEEEIGQFGRPLVLLARLGLQIGLQIAFIVTIASEYLGSGFGLGAFTLIASDSFMIVDAWAAAPYPPVFVTVDAVLRCQDHVLLIRRAHAPGKGQLAVPGGFIEQRETVWQSCLRELAEETHCDVPEATLRAPLQSVAVFDHPDRSQRGRTITHAHYFDLGNAPLPAVQADDDALQAEWIPVGQIAALEAEFFEDHFHMLDHFLQITGLVASAG